MADRPWKAVIEVMGEQIQKGVRPFASFQVMDAGGRGRVETFVYGTAHSLGIHAKVSDLPDGSVGQGIYFNVHLYKHPRALEVFYEAMKLDDTNPVRHAVLGFLYGYSPDEIFKFIDKGTICGG